MKQGKETILTAAVIVSALGYFVDVYDLALFIVLRNPSLKDLGLEGDALTKAGLFLMNMQMAGMLLGGMLWGILGDKKGRLQVLFGSILLYSVANIANAFVDSVSAYGVWRFLAGIGLAGEVGAGITLVAEALPKEKRGLGTTLVATVGVSGAIAAGFVGDLLPWRTAYIVGGVMGLALLVLRSSVRESHLFKKAAMAENIKCGNFLYLFTGWQRFRYYLACIVMGVPVWYLIGVLVMLSPEIGKNLGIAEPLKAAHTVLAYSVFLAVGDLASGLLSQIFKTRKKVIIAFLSLFTLTLFAFFTVKMTEAWQAYAFYCAMGFFIGIWAVLITTASELFGTNLRATVTSTVPNFIRGAVLLLNLALGALGFMGFLTAVQVIGAVVVLLSLVAAFSIPETFHKDLDFYEEDK